MALFADWFVPHTKKPVDPFATGASSPFTDELYPMWKMVLVKMRTAAHYSKKEGPKPLRISGIQKGNSQSDRYS
jgi:hypothetical protein